MNLNSTPTLQSRWPGTAETGADAADERGDLVEALRTALERARSSFITLIDAVPDGVTLLDREGRIREANLAACRSFGVDRDTLLRMTVYDINPALGSTRIRDVIDEFGDGEPFLHVTANVRADGSTYPVEVFSRVFRLDGEPHVIAVARDISGRLAAEQARRDSEARYRQVLQAMDKGVLLQDATGRVLSANPAACRMLGRSEESLTSDDRSHRLWDFIDEHGAPISADDLPSARALHERRTIESTTVGIFDRKGERRLWLAVTATPLYTDGASAPSEVISTFSDVTALKRDSDLFLRTQQLARIGGWDLDTCRNEMYWTEPLYRMFDMAVDANVDLASLQAHVHEHDRDEVRIAFDDAVRNGTPIDLECRVIGRRGRLRWTRLIGEAQHRDGTVYRVSGTLQDITKDKLLEDTLRRQALTDPLTGLTNRDAIIEKISEALRETQLQSPPAVVHVDLDRFKVVNDLLGHQGGDALVRAAGQRLLRAVGEDGTVARLSGDEFVVLLPQGGQAGGQALAERINHEFKQPFLHDGEEFSITASIGVARYPDDGATSQQLLQSADVAMLEAKRRGRNTWQAFDPALARQISDRLLIETQLRRALENNEFHLVFQPQVELSDGRMRSAEALLRWNNRLLGPMRPDLFIPIAETTGDIVRIGAWVLRESCRQLREWRNNGVQLDRVAVNVSFRQFLNEDFARHVLDALAEFDLAGDSLELEITERAVLEDAADTLNTLRGLKQRGVTVSIDDFGEGYSALNYLRRLPIDALKISHGFMKEIPASTTDAVVCRSIIQIAHSLGLTVVGEGVEGIEQRRFLLDHGADLAQGYLFSKPVLPDDIARYEPPPNLGQANASR